MKPFLILGRFNSSWAILDSGITSILSFIVVVASSRVGGAETIGQVALLASVVLAFIGFSRLGIGLPFLKAISSRESQPTKLVASMMIPIAAAIGVLGVLLALLTDSFILFTGALWVVTALIQDAERYILIAQEQYGRLVIIDIAALLVAFLGLVFANSSAEIALAVSLGYCISTAVAKIFSRSTPSSGILDSWRTWRHEMVSAAGPLLLDGLVFIMVSQSLVWILAIRADVDEVGVFRVALLLAFPLSVIQAGVSNPILQKLASCDLSVVTRLARKLSLQLTAGATALALLSLLLLPVVNRIMLTPPAKVGVLLAFFVLGNAILVFASEPLNRGCVVKGKVLAMASWRALSGTLAFLIVLATNLGTTANGVALAVLMGQCAFVIALWRILRDRQVFQSHQGKHSQKK
jgi:O-antigen/teichoic acid export membrane protein